MLGPMGSTIISILRVLTPSEIDRYTEEHSVVESVNGQVGKIASGAEGFEPSDFSSSQKFSQAQKDNQQHNEVELEHEAKIIPINSSIEIEHKPLDIPVPVKEIELEEADGKSTNNNSNILNALESIGIEPKKTLRRKEERKRDQENAKKESTSIFILNEREKLKESQNKLAGQAAILEYKKSATQEITNSNAKDNKKEKCSSSSSGILINKKHY